MRLATKILLISILINLSAYGQTGKGESKKDFINYKAIKNFPKPTGKVNDFELILDFAQIQQLDSIINNFENSSQNQIAIVTIESFEPYETLGDFTTDLGNYWGVGHAGKNNGLILTISKKMRMVWIGSGVGTEKVLTDEILQNVVSTKMIPNFKNGDYFNGIKSGLIECINLWK